MTYPVFEGPTRALRARSREVLAAELQATLADRQAEYMRDWRDMLVAIAPYHHCALEIGVDPVDLFAEAAGTVPPEIAEQVRAFGERTDIRPQSFAFALDRDADGPLYRGTTSIEDTQAALKKLRDAGFIHDA